MPILMAPLNKEVKIVRISADDKVRKHLEDMGVTLGGVITVLSNAGGNVVVKIKDSRVALDKNLCSKIFIA